MDRICDKCKDTRLVAVTRNFQFGLASFESLSMKEIEYFCPSCGQRTTNDPFSDSLPQSYSAGDNAPQSSACRKQVILLSNTSSKSDFVSVQFPAVYQVDSNVLFPTFEGNIQDGTVIDRHGNPDLMLLFAKQYLESYKAIMPVGRLPKNLVEIMPALHLLVTAAELAFKALLTRDGKKHSGHSLQRLYENLNQCQRNWIDTSFAKSLQNANLLGLGVTSPTVYDILTKYDNTYGGSSGVYVDSRYYAEPTARLKHTNDLHGTNLVKGNTPYPIFLPEIVYAQIGAYQYFSGHERLRRLGGDVRLCGRELESNTRGRWSFVPSSLGLVVVSVPQRAGTSAEGVELASFEQLLTEHPPIARMDWMYGGNTLLVYGLGDKSPRDGHGSLNGVQCQVWRDLRIGIHSRDLCLIAERLECSELIQPLSNVQFK